jgi:hypothetical protein
VLRWVAADDGTVCDGLVELVERVRDAGFDEASDLAYYPLYRADETVAVTVTVGELTERGLVDGAIGVGWADRDECTRHALEAARHRPVEDRCLRGIVVFAGRALDCDTCDQASPGPGINDPRPN